MEPQTKFDVIIIGGSNSGLSAGMALGRSLFNTLIIDSGKPCNRQTPHSHNFIMHDGWTPADMHTAAKKDVLAYPNVKYLNGTATTLTGSNNNFELTLAESDKTYQAKKVIITTGIKDIFPDIAGFAECWGISIIHCPYCHGYEYRDEETGILANGDIGYDLAKLISNWTNKLTVFTNGKATFTGEQQQVLNRNNINIIEANITGVEHQDGYINKLQLSNGESLALKALYARLPFIQHTDIAEKIGYEFTEQGYIKVDMLQKTSVQGIFASGDCTSPMRAVSAAVASGTMAGVAAGKELMEERF
ncbi:NAD(P)/FAD-dependent oxidoreductase [Mucilaginibacter sp. UR6-1]|uniref:NAD(P)/FAD-dependent oxidoreductase n=1 Tax=Mucilaginibacter sp. UR6-1 TaxID=1435643 RepID=UPI001E58CD02|nr:NAD(P)/FAD-dependent oxidoreductase [Mucilaginibacter sp. UR6-1]MCC8410642.1 NAD(P)/FAD-dependent oxidoreductase [Mucilaginibacter sp. UR6-1]